MGSTYTDRYLINKPYRYSGNWEYEYHEGMDKIDSAIYDNYQEILLKYGDLVGRLGSLPEIYVISSIFNGSTGVVINLPKVVDAITEYVVIIEPITRDNPIGDIYIIQDLSGFIVKCSENNTTDSFNAIILYREDTNPYGVSFHRKWYVSPIDGINHADEIIPGSLAWIIDQIGEYFATIELPGNHEYVFSGKNFTVPSNITLIFQHGAVLTKTVPYSITINGSIIASPVPIESGTGDLLFGDKIREIYTAWFSDSDIGTRINAAINACVDGIPHVLNITPNEWIGVTFSNTILVNKPVIINFPGILSDPAIHSGSGNAIEVISSGAQLLGGIHLSQEGNGNPDIDMIYIYGNIRNVVFGPLELVSPVRDGICIDGYNNGSYMHHFNGHVRISDPGGCHVRFTRGNITLVSSSDVDTDDNSFAIWYDKFYDRISDGDSIIFRILEGSLPSPLIAGTVYYARKLGGDKIIHVATSPSGSPIDLLGTGYGKWVIEDLTNDSGKPNGITFSSGLHLRGSTGHKFGIMHEIGNSINIIAPYFNQTSYSYTNFVANTIDDTIQTDEDFCNNIITGDRVLIQDGGNGLPDGLDEGIYYVIKGAELAKIKLATSYDNALNNIFVDILTSGGINNIITEYSTWGVFSSNTEHPINLLGYFFDGSCANGVLSDNGATVNLIGGHSNMNWDGQYGIEWKQVNSGNIYGINNGIEYVRQLRTIEDDYSNIKVGALQFYLNRRFEWVGDYGGAIYSTNGDGSDPFNSPYRLIIEGGNGRNVYICAGPGELIGKYIMAMFRGTGSEVVFPRNVRISNDDALATAKLDIGESGATIGDTVPNARFRGYTATLPSGGSNGDIQIYHSGSVYRLYIKIGGQWRYATLSA